MDEAPLVAAVTSKEAEDAYFLGFLQPRPGEHVLDAGCGTGRFLARGAAAHPETVWVGVDNRRRPLRSARHALTEHGDRGAALLAIADLRRLPYSDGAFEVVVCMETLECFPDPAKTLQELMRVLGRRGRLLVMHSDWDTLVFNVPDRPLERKMASAWINTHQRWMETADAAMGRKLWGIARSLGLEDLRRGVVVMTETAWTPGSHSRTVSEGAAILALETGVADESERDRWLGLLQAADNEGTYLSSVSHYWFCGRRP